MTPATDPRRAVDRVARWARELRDAEAVELCCAEASPPRVEPPHRLVQLSACLTSLDPADLAELAAAAPGLVVHVRGCGGSGLAATVDRLRVLLDALGAGERLRVAVEDSAARSAVPAAGRAVGRAAGTAELPVSRRQLFGWVRRPQEELSGDGEETSSRRAPSGGTMRRAPTHPSDFADHGEAADQVRLAAALRELHRQGAGGRPGGDGHRHPDDGPPREGATGSRSGWLGPSRALRLASSGCTACSTCVRACPTHALSLTPRPEDGEVLTPRPEDGEALTPRPEDGEPGGAEPDPPGDEAVLAVKTAACIGCRQCVALCPVQAITSGEALSWTDLAGLPALQELETVQARPCTRCRAPFAGEGELCQVCRMRSQNPFGSWLPPGYVTPRVYAPPPDG